MWPFSKPAPPLTNESYAQWLRAHRPPFVMFMALSPMEREQLAIMGDEYVMGLAEMAAPEQTQDQEDAVTRALKKGIEQVVQGHTGRPPAYTYPEGQRPTPPPVPTMAGMGKAPETKVEGMRDPGEDGARIMGKQPDNPEAGP